MVLTGKNQTYHGDAEARRKKRIENQVIKAIIPVIQIFYPRKTPSRTPGAERERGGRG